MNRWQLTKYLFSMWIVAMCNPQEFSRTCILAAQSVTDDIKQSKEVKELIDKVI